LDLDVAIALAAILASLPGVLPFLLEQRITQNNAKNAMKGATRTGKLRCIGTMLQQKSGWTRSALLHARSPVAQMAGLPPFRSGPVAVSTSVELQADPRVRAKLEVYL
jgi:hypothetical protein